MGTLAVGSLRWRSGFRREPAELLEVLASTAAAALAALERARLDGVLLAARTAQHELNNQLAVARGYAELLVGSPELPAHLADIAEEVMRAADDATRIIRQLRAVSRIRETRWSDPADTTINLADSAA
jgi:signal transduction histidine kinase